MGRGGVTDAALLTTELADVKGVPRANSEHVTKYHLVVPWGTMQDCAPTVAQPLDPEMRVTSYRVTLRPPVFSGAFHVTLKVPSPDPKWESRSRPDGAEGNDRHTGLRLGVNRDVGGTGRLDRLVRSVAPGWSWRLGQGPRECWAGKRTSMPSLL